MSTHEERVEMHAKFLTLLANIGSTEERAKRMNVVSGPSGPECAFIAYEAKQMLAAVNEIRTARGLTPATLDEVRRIEQSASGHSDYGWKYALRCAFLALGEDPGW